MQNGTHCSALLGQSQLQALRGHGLLDERRCRHLMHLLAVFRSSRGPVLGEGIWRTSCVDIVGCAIRHRRYIEHGSPGSLPNVKGGVGLRMGGGHGRPWLWKESKLRHAERRYWLAPRPMARRGLSDQCRTSIVTP